MEWTLTSTRFSECKVTNVKISCTADEKEDALHAMRYILSRTWISVMISHLLDITP